MTEIPISFDIYLLLLLGKFFSYNLKKAKTFKTTNLFLRISVVSDEKSLGLRLPYATINYETIGSLENGKSPVIHFAVKNTISMDEAMKSLEVGIITSYSKSRCQ